MTVSMGDDTRRGEMTAGEEGAEASLKSTSSLAAVEKDAAKSDRDP